MDEKALQASYHRIGLSPEASMRQVEQSFRELRDLYLEDSLATYSLLKDADRDAKLESLQASFDLIRQSRLHASAAPLESMSMDSDEEPSASEARIVLIDADPQLMPGLFLQQTRKARGLSLQDVAARTKISLYQLQNIEEQHFEILPAPVYLRGFLKEFSRTVGVPEYQTLVDSFLELYLHHR